MQTDSRSAGRDDTITALSSGAGGAVALIRISGTGALSIGNSVWKGGSPMGKDNARMVRLGKCCVLSAAGFEKVIAVFFPSPKTYTGEDMVELYCHGGALVIKKILEMILNHGARHAEPGEFTLRAFLNGKLDLAQAEAVADIISAQSNMSLSLAERQLQGVVGKKVREIREHLVYVLSECESRLDFGEENLDWASSEELCRRMEYSSGKIRDILKFKTEGNILRNGVRIVIAGRPNVGKSSLLNLLLGFERAIVTPIPGTTRDTVEEQTVIRNIPVRLVDTAGIREAESLIENMGVERSFASLKQAQIIIWLLDATEDWHGEIKTMNEYMDGRKNVIAVWNKIDLLAKDSKLPETVFMSARVSVEKESGISGLLDCIEKQVWGYPHTDEPEMAVSFRHAALFEEALKMFPSAVENLRESRWELAAVHLRSAIDSLGKITGETASPDILGEIFSRFCIGK